jgi:peptidoglycan-associated lipoprotein
MRKPSLFLIVLLVLGLSLFATGCPKKPEKDVPEEPETTAAETTQPAPEPVETEPPMEVEDFARGEAEVETIVEPTIAELNERGVLKTVYFDFDKSDLTDETRALLRANAEWLRGNAKYGVVIEGHCDERGTIEYNLALGQRRAQTVRDYLSSLGVSPSRLRTKSYGEERPAVQGHTEEAWGRNRRAEFVIE